MKKFFILFINIILFILIFFVCDFYVFQNEAKHYLPKNFPVYTYYKNFVLRDTSRQTFDKQILSSNNNSELFHKVLNEESKESPILLFGCSYVYGHHIPLEKSMHKVLQKYTTRPIYDRSCHGWGVNQMLYQLKNSEFYKIIPQKPHKIIYVYMPDHINRLYKPCMYSIYEYYGAFFKFDKFGKLVKRKDFDGYNRFNLIAHIYDSFNRENDKEKIKKFLYNHFSEAKTEIEKHWKDSDFIILEYFPDEIFESIKPDLQKRGFVIIDRNDLVKFEYGDERYCLGKADGHPNQHAWEAIIPKLMKQNILK